MRCRALLGRPQRRARFLQFLVTTPRKPNSAVRKVGRVSIRLGRMYRAKLIGQGFIPHKYASVLLRGGGFRDTPGSYLTIVRGAYECLAFFSRPRRKSLFGGEKVGRTYVRRSLR